MFLDRIACFPLPPLCNLIHSSGEERLPPALRSLHSGSSQNKQTGPQTHPTIWTLLGTRALEQGGPGVSAP